MAVKSEGFGFCLEVESDEFEGFLKKIVNTEMDQISDIAYDKGEKAEIEFEDTSQLSVVPSDKDGKDIHIHYVPGSDLENTEAGDEIKNRIEELIEGNNTDLIFFALSLRLDIATPEAIRKVADFEEDMVPKGLELEREGKTYSLYNFHDSRDTVITIRLNNPEYQNNLEEVKQEAEEYIDNFLDTIGENYES